MAAGGNRRDLAQELFTLNPIDVNITGARNKVPRDKRGGRSAGGCRPPDGGMEGDEARRANYRGYEQEDGPVRRGNRRAIERDDGVVDRGAQHQHNGGGQEDGPARRGNWRRMERDDGVVGQGVQHQCNGGGQALPYPPRRPNRNPRGDRNDREMVRARITALNQEEHVPQNPGRQHAVNDQRGLQMPRGGANNARTRGGAENRRDHPIPGQQHGRDQGGRTNDNGSSNRRGRNGNGPSSSGGQRHSETNQSRPSDRGGRDDGPKQRKYIPSYTKMLELSELEASDVLALIANSHNNFLDLIAGDLRPDMVVLVVKVLAKACQSDYRENKGKLLSSVCSCKGFLDKITKHSAGVYTDTDRRRKAGAKDFFVDLYIFLETVIDMLPTTACECLGDVLPYVQVGLNDASEFQVSGQPFEDSLLKRPAELKAKLREIVIEKETKKTYTSRLAEQMSYQQPPDNFRDLSIFPTPRDILSDDQAFIRPNIIDGAYEDIDHYLDIQFRLLREDFVRPLREGIMQFIAQRNKPSKQKVNIRLYKNVHINSVEVKMNNMGLVVEFDSSGKSSKIKWEYSKRFMFGSLLCFTKNDFESVFFATVLNRDPKQLEKGQVVVQLSAGSEMFDDIFQAEYLMVESEVYFEPYYHVLNALQRMRPRDFPMSEYIVRVQAHSSPPQYVWLAPNYRYNIEGYHVSVLDDRTWPTAAQLALDDSQYAAYKAALTKEFVVIQGPPGTGKTYLGLKIAKALLVNMKPLLKNADFAPRREMDHLDSSSDGEAEEDPTDPARRQSPILVVCFTNHALDQFLEGLMEQTQSIIRVGGQSKSDKLKAFNLKEVRRQRGPGKNASNLSRDIRATMSTLMRRIEGIQKDMEHLDSCRGIVASTCISGVFQHPSLAHLNGNDGQLSDDQVLTWLSQGMEGFVDPTTDQAPGDQAQLDANDPDDAVDILDEDQGEELWQRAPEDDLDLDRNIPIEVQLSYATNFKHYEDKISDIEQELDDMDKLPKKGDFVLYDRGYALREERVALERELAYFKYMLAKRTPHDQARVHNLLAANVNLWHMAADDRWSLYRHWLMLIRRTFEDELRRVEVLYRDETKQYQEAKEMEDLEMMRKVDVLGMTTTGAARLQTLLQALKSRIVIVEEAAEVMESHIIVSLTSHCQHVILIGDHEQLRPTTAVYKLARDYFFDISLFERMLKNGLHCEMLQVQHRMRPEIARLIVPAIYSSLDNHASVLDFPRVRGVTRNLFFLHHTNKELEVAETSSRSNPFEADTLLALCRYLLLQGYDPKCITLLTTYSGQMFYLRKERAKYPTLRDVQMTIVDNFQGEENDIIILSLVRNNEQNNVGFLKIKNRVCVALSRAKHGMFIMGNLDNLTASSEVWPIIKEALVEQDASGTKLMLQCQIHPEQRTAVKSAADFHQVPEGGCRLPCAADLLCGHRCKSLCHANNRDHKEYQCYEPCTRIPLACDLEHLCPKSCGMDCGLCEIGVCRELPACEHVITLPCHLDHLRYLCEVKIQVTSVLCGHTFDKPCHSDKEICPFPCENRLICGHSCVRKCHAGDDEDHLQYKCNQPCPKKNVGCRKKHMCAKRCYEECGACAMEVQMSPPDCDHMYKVACSSDPAAIKCVRPCKRKLPCGHPCRKKCVEACGDCDVKVKKRVQECGHEVTVKCSEVPERKHCNGACTRRMPCGHGCVRSCKSECSPQTDCIVLVRSSVTPACGHAMQVPCNVQLKNLPPTSPELLAYCGEKCTAVLKCEHPCAGTCGTCLQGRIHLGCQSKCGRVLVCGHECKVACSETCPPCSVKCDFFCKHSKCNLMCGVPCKSCKMRCTWSCEHHSCTQLCGQQCNREACNEPCPKRLPCKHPCIGYCGEPCPPLCRICDEEEVTTVFFGNEDEPDARFVYLEDCKHTIESGAVETWLGRTKEEVTMPECPKCKTPIMKTLRYMNYIKVVLKDVSIIKKKVFGVKADIDKKRGEIVARLNTAVVAGLSGGRAELYKKLAARLQPVRNNRVNHLSMMDLETIGSQVAILEEVQQIFTATARKLLGASLSTLSAYADLLLSAVCKRDRMSAQEIDDFNVELLRLQQIMRYCELETVMASQPPSARSIFYRSAGDKNLAWKNAASGLLFALGKYTQDAKVTGVLKEWAANMNAVMLDMERKSIVAAMNMEKGHWFKCPNGHYYIIGDCGGATVKSRCPECNEEIGGSQHRLLASNRVATEMDGATMSAYDINAAVYRRL